MGKNLARMEMQVFLQELTRRLPHMKLAEQRFSYVANTSFRGPEHLWVEWDPAKNPERTTPAVLEKTLAGAHRRAVEARHRPARCRSSASRRRPTASSGCAWSRPTAATLPRWTPGSHIDVECGDTGLSRQYSLCGDPADAKAFEIAVLREAESRGGSAWMHGDGPAGDRLHVSAPRNHFRLDESARRLIFIAGGIGITPIAAMARRARELGIDYALHYSGRRRAAMALRRRARRPARRAAASPRERGRRAQRPRRAAARAGRRHPGLRLRPGAHARCARRGLGALARGVAAGRALLHRQGQARSRAASTRFEVELADSGLVLPVRADQTLLAALRAANIDVRSDCEEGLCGSCEVAVLAGRIDHRDLVLTPAERAEGTRMMACCSRACDARLVLGL